MKIFTDIIFIPLRLLKNTFVSSVMSGHFPDETRNKSSFLTHWVEYTLFGNRIKTSQLLFLISHHGLFYSIEA